LLSKKLVKSQNVGGKSEGPRKRREGGIGRGMGGNVGSIRNFEVAGPSFTILY